MAKPKTAARKPRAKAAPKAAAKPIENASGAQVKTEGANASASTDEAKAKVEGAGIQSSASDSAGAAGASTADAAGAPAESSAPVDESPAPLAGIVVVGPKNGRWRSGLKFGREAVVLDTEVFKPVDGELSREGGERLYAILTDPKLRCSMRDQDGNEEPIAGEVIEHMRQHLDKLAELDRAADA